MELGLPLELAPGLELELALELELGLELRVWVVWNHELALCMGRLRLGRHLMLAPLVMAVPMVACIEARLTQRRALAGGCQSRRLQ